MPDATEPTYNLRTLQSGLFDLAKARWRDAIILKGLAAVWGLLSLTPVHIGFVALPVLAFTILSEFLSFWSDSWKSLALRVLDKLDFFESLGWAIKAEERRDIVAKAPEWLCTKSKSDKPADPYFAAKEDVGVKKALANLEESSWWTEHLATSTFNYLVGLSALLMVGVVFYFLGMLFFVHEHQERAARLGVAVLSLLPSLGVFKLMSGYASFSSAAAKIKERAGSFMRTSKLPSEHDVVKLWFEYQAKRSSAPMIPSWLYRLQQARLNLLWNEHKASDAPTQKPT